MNPLALLLLAALASLTGAPSAPGRPQRDDAELARAWAGLDESARREAAAWLALELEAADAAQAAAVLAVSRRATVDPGFWEAPRPLEPYPSGDAADQAAARDDGGEGVTAAGEEQRVRLNERLEAGRGDEPDPVVERAWAYRWSERALVRVGDPDDPALAFRFALRGTAPGTDYAEAVLLHALDDGSQRAVFAAFAHAYRDPTGAPHPDVALGDAWASDLALAPDDLRALAAELGVDAEREAIDAAFRRARDHRDLRVALARCYLFAEPPLPSGFEERQPILHALWAQAEWEPSALVRLLEEAPRAADVFSRGARAFRERSLRERSRSYRARLEASRELVRATLERVLEGLGAFAPPDDAPLAAGDPEQRVEEEAHARVAGALTPDDEAALLERVARRRRTEREALLDACERAVRESGAWQVEAVASWTREWTGDGAARSVEDLPPPSEHGAHDARVYRGGPPRRVLPASSRTWQSFCAGIELEPAPDRTRPVRYELATGRLVHQPPDRGERVGRLRELLAGRLPDQDLAEALVLRALDATGPLRAEAEYFAHLYCDREANAFAGVTLYDAWLGGRLVEVPDVDARAYALKLWNDDSLPVPLGPPEKQLWYPRIASSADALRAFAEPVRGLAAVWFTDEPPLPGAFERAHDVLHAAIVHADGDPSPLADRLAADASAFAGDVHAELRRRGASGWEEVRGRRERLRAGQAAIRAATLGVLREAGLLPDGPGGDAR